MSTLQCTEILTVHILPEIKNQIKKPDEQLPCLDQQQLSNTNKKIRGPVVVMPVTKSSKLVKNLSVPNSTASDFEELIQPTAILSKASNDTAKSPVLISDPISDSTEELDEDIISNSEIYVQKPALLVKTNMDKISDEIKKTFQEHIKIPDIGVEEVIQYLEFEDYKTLAFLFDNDKSKSYVTGTEKDYELKLISRSEVQKFRNEQRSRHAYKWSVFKCELCIDQFPNSQELKEHSLQHEPPKKSKKTAPNNSRLASKIYKRKETIAVKCHHCEEFFTGKAALKAHVDSLTRNLSCATCRKKFSSRREFRKHVVWGHESDAVPKQEMDIEEIRTENEEYTTEVPETEMDIEEIKIEDEEFTSEVGEESEEIYTEVEFLKSEEDSDTDIDKIKLEIDDITTEEYIIS
ncbi:hypothetical protein B5X24_HaOG216106 [Helicoverpa armigera]|uniref:C2H2-type domain-containing protein n=1 Tax=Helicoverpa armigera TaxID=29058 RepID=A0A2W1AZ97_HELAM|nr:hypothetical protein B5X24_HaOG216106 [Helicoverpa armigera]